MSAIPATVRIYLAMCPSSLSGIWSAYWCGRLLFWWNHLSIYYGTLAPAAGEPAPALGMAVVSTSVIVGILTGWLTFALLAWLLFPERRKQ